MDRHEIWYMDINVPFRMNCKNFDVFLNIPEVQLLKQSNVYLQLIVTYFIFYVYQLNQKLNFPHVGVLEK